jgi:hypothetical protein
MSGRLGNCIKCGKDTEGVYTIEVCRGWVGDKYQFYAELCEECVGDLVKWLGVSESRQPVGDELGIAFRKRNARVVDVEQNVGKEGV